MTQTVKNAQWQELMDSFHTKWEEDGLSCKETLHYATPLERDAAILGWLNYQVEDGGFIQWADNGYASDSWDRLPTLLQSLGGVSKKVLLLCQEMMRYVVPNTGGLSEDFDQLAHQQMHDMSDRISNEFYKLQDEWHVEVNAYLSQVDVSAYNHAIYLMKLSETIFKIPVLYGVNQWDYEQLREIAAQMSNRAVSDHLEDA